MLNSIDQKKEKKFFHVANTDVFATELISMPITLQFFLGCNVKHQIIGFILPGKDLIIGFDVYTKNLVSEFYQMS